MNENNNTSTQKLLQALLSQIEERDKVIESLQYNISKERDLKNLIAKEKEKKSNITISFLIALLILSFISNILCMVYL